MPIGEPASIGRKTSEWKLSTNADVATVQNTYETVYSFIGTGMIVEVVLAAGAGISELGAVEITVDGGTLYEMDMSNQFVGSGARTWADDNTFNFRLGVDSEFKTSILIRAKNDTNTTTLAVSVSSSEDQ